VGCETDVWSFGILCLEVIANRRINTLLEGQAPPAQRPNFPSPELLERIGEEKLRSLVKKMLSRRREKRPTMAAVVEKLDKRLASLRKGCDTEELQLDLPLEESGFDPSPPRPEWTRRIEPKKEKAKVERYKMKTRQGSEVEVRYDDYR
jgi:serine/threonine protein kinase